MVKVNGSLLISGNVTGIDAIKDDDYTKVGTPTITTDGIITFADSSNYVEITYDFTQDHTFYFRHVGNNTTLLAATKLLNNAYQLYLSPTYPNNFKILLGTGASYTVCEIQNTLFRNDYVIDVKIKKSDLTYVVDYVINGTTSGTITKTFDSIPVTLSSIKVYEVPNEAHSVDLNCIKIYDNTGVLVKQACLKISYTLSNTDLKITRNMDRAIDMANQCGYSQYFGIDEQNGLCLVPQGDNITGRRDLVHREEDSSTHYIIERYSDLYCKQQGTCTANTPVVFAQPYKDDYPKISVPYSAKSKTGFTPTVSGEWTAEGYTYLV